MEMQSKHAPFPPLIQAEVGKEELVLRLIPTPADCNMNGHVFGGWLMGQVDIAGAVLAFRAAAGKKAVTVAVNNLIFKHPVAVNDYLTFYAKILKIGTTSITIEVNVYAWNHQNFDRGALHVVEACLTYVAIDGAGNPMPVLA